MGIYLLLKLKADTMNKNTTINLVRMARFWNNLLQIMSGDIDNNAGSLFASSDIMSISSVSDPIFNQFKNKFIYMYVSEWSVTEH
jgi:hypothetical protein